MSSHGIDVNLATLAKSPNAPYDIQNDKDHYTFNICAANDKCGDRNAHANQVCLLDENGNAKRIGHF